MYIGAFNLDLLTIGISIAAIGILGFVVFLQNTRSATNRAFLFAAIMTGLYGTANYLNYQVSEPSTILWLIRIVIFLAVWHSFSFFYLFYVFPAQSVIYPRWYKYILIPIVALTSLLTLTPFVFPTLLKVGAIGEVSTPEVGAGAPFFFAIVAGLVISGIFILIRKTVHASASQRTPFVIVMVGTIVSFGLLLVLNLILPVLFELVAFVPLSGISMLPFILLTAYAVMKYRLLNVKVIGTEVTAFILTAVTLLQVVSAESLIERIFSLVVFALVLIFSFVLIKGVINEVRQREQIQILADNLKVANVRLKELDAEKSKFLSLASHELRAPLTIVRNFISLVLEGAYGKLPDAAAEGLSKVFERATEMTHSIDSYLNISRIEQGKMKYDFVVDDITSIVRKLVDSNKPGAEQKGLKLSMSLSVNALNVKMDRGKITEAINNLLDNAIKYTSNGSVFVAVESLQGRVRISIKDTGIGMSKNTIDTKLFKLFSTAEGSSTINASSSGIGMYISKAHVEACGGKLWAESEGDRKGSTFILEFPLIETDSKAPFPKTVPLPSALEKKT